VALKNGTKMPGKRADIKNPIARGQADPKPRHRATGSKKNVGTIAQRVFEMILRFMSRRY
jgi:hypothetical protein